MSSSRPVTGLDHSCMFSHWKINLKVYLYIINYLNIKISRSKILSFFFFLQLLRWAHWSLRAEFVSCPLPITRFWWVPFISLDYRRREKEGGLPHFDT